MPERDAEGTTTAPAAAARVAPTAEGTDPTARRPLAITDRSLPNAAETAMERGEQGEEQRQESSVVVAATEEARDEDEDVGRNLAQYYRWMADACNIMLLGLVVGFACIFTYAWVDAFRKVCVSLHGDADLVPHFSRALFLFCFSGETGVCVS